MQVTITIPKTIIDLFIDEFEDANNRKPTKKEIQEFFNEDVPRIYCEVAENEGFIDYF